MPADFALAVSDKCEWAVLSMTDSAGAPYCIPVTIVRDGSAVYFHSAQEGFKTECLRRDGRVCLACVGDTCIQPERFTTEYESAVLRGTAQEVTEDAEKLHALRILCLRHAPSAMPLFDRAAAAGLARTAVWKILIESATGKCNGAK